MLTTDRTGTTLVSLPPVEERYRAAEGADDDPGLYGAGPPRTDWRGVALGGILAFLAGLGLASLLVSLANRWWP